MPARRVVASIGVLGVLAGGLAGGWWAAGVLQSPEQVAARASPPAPSDVVAEVTRGALSEQITARSQIARESATTIGLTLTGAEQSVVTAAGPPVGSDLGSGALALEVNGRPVIATTGSFPYYRDMTEGDTGPDVEQLQRFLHGLGLSTGGVGEFGPRTAQAVRQLYGALGYRPVTRDLPAPAEGAAMSDDRRVTAPESAAGSDEPIAAEASGSTAPAGSGAVSRQAVVVPHSELIVLGSLPAVVGATPAVGTVLTDENAVLAVGQGAVVARARVAVTVLPLISEGMRVALTGPDGSTVDGTLGVIAPPAEAGDTVATDVAVPVVVAEPIAEAWLGSDVLTTITVEVVTDAALRVPSRAVALRADGTDVVQRRAPDGTFNEVEVRELGRMGGTSAVEPVAPGALSEGDQVKVE